MTGSPGARAAPSSHLFATAGRRALAGNVSGWPDAVPGADGWLEFPLWAAREPDDTPHLARARVSALPGGLLLLVGRDMHEIDRACSRIRLALAWSLGLMLILGVAGALAMSRGTMRRIDAINRASREIMGGDLARRIPTRGSRDDFDQLAEQLNAMLDRIQELMDGIRRVTDDIAHDLKTPLTRLRTRLEELRDSGRLGRDSEESVEAAIGESDRLLATFAALLRIARVESKATREGFTTVDLGALAGDAAELYEPYGHERGREVVFLGDAAGVPVTGDRDPPVPGRVEPGRQRPAPWRGPGGRRGWRGAGPGRRAAGPDRGAGRGAGHSRWPNRERVFRRFVRLEASRNTAGNGLGLALVEAVATTARRDRGARGERRLARGAGHAGQPVAAGGRRFPAAAGRVIRTPRPEVPPRRGRDAARCPGAVTGSSRRRPESGLLREPRRSGDAVVSCRPVAGSGSRRGA